MVCEWIVDVISFQKIFGLWGLKGHILESGRDDNGRNMKKGPGVGRNDFWTSGTGTGTRMANSIPNFWERECKWKISFPIFGNGNESGKSIPSFREREFLLTLGKS